MPDLGIGAVLRQSDAKVLAAVEAAVEPLTREQIAVLVIGTFIPGDDVPGTGRALSRLHALGLVERDDPTANPLRWKATP